MRTTMAPFLLELDPSSWTMWTAVEMRQSWVVALIMELVSTTVITMKMLELHVHKVGLALCLNKAIAMFSLFHQKYTLFICSWSLQQH